MAKDIFILGIGGTGMRCIESFIHLCAMGMMDDTTVHLLALDTDKDNGNFIRLRELKDAYCNVKSLTSKDRKATVNTFFSANIQYYEYSPDYSEKNNYRSLADYDLQSNSDVTAVADLVLSKNAQTFDLRHGYRAQTHLGSMLMYHSIIKDVEEDRPASKGSLSITKFVDKLVGCPNGRVFILGSVFGGTGASSIPVIPLALSDAAKIRTGGSAKLLDSIYFGASLLTAYFSFNVPSDSDKDKEKIIATSDKFALNSQAALMFYNDDKTVGETYQRFYLIGTEGLDWQPSPSDKTITGGDAQKNESHYVELMAAFAAYDFFKLKEDDLSEVKDAHEKAKYYFRTISADNRLEFEDFVGNTECMALARKFGLLIALTFFSNSPKLNFFRSVKDGHLTDKKIKGYEDIDENQIKALEDYCTLFHFGVKDKVFYAGWLKQLHRSAGGDNKFLFNPKLFIPEDMRAYEKFAYNEDIYPTDRDDLKKKQFATGLFGKPQNKFIDTFTEIEQKRASEISETNLLERLIKITYFTMCKLYGFE